MENWTRGPTIGRGSTATVSLAVANFSGDLSAVKSAELSSSLCLQREQFVLSKVNCPRIVKYIGFSVTQENNTPLYNLFMEYVSGGSLCDVIRSHGGRLDEPMIRSYTRQILQGLCYLHSNGLAHCDMKSQNVLMGEDGAKIADLGCAKFVPEVAGDGVSAISGTPAFMAPEVARGEEQGFAADVWAVGCTVIEMATGANPWPELKDPVSALYKIGFSGDGPEKPSWLSESGKDFLNKCLTVNPEQRWTARELLDHPFLDEMEAGSKEITKINSYSPSSVLDQCFWDSMEISGAPNNLTDHPRNSTNSPSDRIHRLIQTSSSVTSSLPNWKFDNDWITVRSNDDIEEDNPENNELPSSLATGISMDSHEEDEEEDRGSFLLEEEDLLMSEYSVEITISNFQNLTVTNDDFELKNLGITTEDSSFPESNMFLNLNHKYIKHLITFLYVIKT